jgi:hypothetical protein
VINDIVAFFHSNRYFIWSEDGQVLDVSGASLDDGAPVIQYTLNGGANQQWMNIPTDNGWYEIVNVNSGKCLTVDHVDGVQGRGLIQWPCQGGAGQQWYQQSGGYQYIWNRNSGQVVDIPGASILIGKQLEQWGANGGWNQYFTTSPA